jgi:2-hydroxycyclohexanecarboxyl-CoA dehydrogenase
MGGRLAGRMAIVTGGAGGIGSATGQVFCEEGARVALVDVDAAELDAVAARISAAVPGAEVLVLAADLAEEAEADRVVTEAAERFGGLDTLVNNAGIRAYEPLAEASGTTWRRVLAVNLLSYAFMARAALPWLRQAGNGSIVNVSSTYGVTGRGGMGQYDATKGAIISLSRSLAFEEAEHGVRVNSLCPGYTVTPFHVRNAEAQGRTEAELRGEEIAACLMRRWADPREIALPILWLASDEASYVTAANFMIDGGRPVV